MSEAERLRELARSLRREGEDKLRAAADVELALAVLIGETPCPEDAPAGQRPFASA